jgi:hypothetical protein
MVKDDKPIIKRLPFGVSMNKVDTPQQDKRLDEISSGRAGWNWNGFKRYVSENKTIAGIAGLFAAGVCLAGIYFAMVPMGGWDYFTSQFKTKIAKQERQITANKLEKKAMEKECDALGKEKESLSLKVDITVEENINLRKLCKEYEKKYGGLHRDNIFYKVQYGTEEGLVIRTVATNMSVARKAAKSMGIELNNKYSMLYCGERFQVGHELERLVPQFRNYANAYKNNELDVNIESSTFRIGNYSNDSIFMGDWKENTHFIPKKTFNLSTTTVSELTEYELK